MWKHQSVCKYWPVQHVWHVVEKETVQHSVLSIMKEMSYKYLGKSFHVYRVSGFGRALWKGHTFESGSYKEKLIRRVGWSWGQ